jgi:chromosome transmission fidelity protein 1
MIENAKQEKRRGALRAREELEERLAKARAKEERMKRQHESGEPVYKKRVCAIVDSRD